MRFGDLFYSKLIRGSPTSPAISAHFQNIIFLQVRLRKFRNVLNDAINTTKWSTLDTALEPSVHWRANISSHWSNKKVFCPVVFIITYRACHLRKAIALLRTSLQTVSIPRTSGGWIHVSRVWILHSWCWVWLPDTGLRNLPCSIVMPQVTYSFQTPSPSVKTTWLLGFWKNTRANEMFSRRSESPFNYKKEFENPWFYVTWISVMIGNLTAIERVIRDFPFGLSRFLGQKYRIEWRSCRRRNHSKSLRHRSGWSGAVLWIKAERLWLGVSC